MFFCLLSQPATPAQLHVPKTATKAAGRSLCDIDLLQIAGLGALASSRLCEPAALRKEANATIGIPSLD